MIELRQSDEFTDWLDGLADRHAQIRITARLVRAADGNLGDHKALGGNLSEMKLSYGPGYRLYYTKRGVAIILLLCGGDKGSQQRDIARARKMLEALD